jgi:hypothetical protein
VEEGPESIGEERELVEGEGGESEVERSPAIEGEGAEEAGADSGSAEGDEGRHSARGPEGDGPDSASEVHEEAPVMATLQWWGGRVAQR